MNGGSTESRLRWSGLERRGLWGVRWAIDGCSNVVPKGTMIVMATMLGSSRLYELDKQLRNAHPKEVAEYERTRVVLKPKPDAVVTGAAVEAEGLVEDPARAPTIEK
jgi:hypothetical protein